MQKNYLFRNSIISIISMLVLVVIFYLWFDIPVEHWFLSQSHGGLFRFCKNVIAPIFASKHWLLVGILSLALGLLLLLFDQRKMALGWLFFSFVIILTFVLGGILKFLLARYRPKLYFMQGLYGFHFFSLKHNWNSMPSGHAALSFAGCFALARIFRKRVLTFILLLIATLIALSPLVILAHYPSDIIFGAYLGILSVYWVARFFPVKRQVAFGELVVS